MLPAVANPTDKRSGHLESEVYSMKRMTGAILLFCFAIGLQAQNITEKNMELVKSYAFGDQHNNFAVVEAGPLGVPSGPLIGQTNNGILIYDILNNRLVELDDDFNFGRIIELKMRFDISPYQSLTDSTYVLATTLQGFAIFNSDTAVLRELWLVSFPEFRNYRSFAYYDDVLFVHDAELNLWSIPEPVIDQDENRAKLLNERQTREYVNERWGASGEVQVDGEGRLFIDGQLVTRDWSAYLEYYAERNENQQAPSYAAERPYRGYLDRFRNNLRYLGRDANGNRYWNSAQRTIFVFSEDGWVEEIFHYDPLQISGYPAVEYQTGDLYFLGRPVENNTSIPLYRIPNDWSPIDAGH
jgi:hypothetical protein